MPRIMKALSAEIISIIPAVIFFAITFNLIVLTEKLMIGHNTPSYLSYSLATLSALIVGKCLIIINSIPYINAFPKKPLIYNIVWKFFIYVIFIFIFRIADKALEFYFKDDNATLMYRQVEDLFSRPSFWAIQVWLIMSFTVYIVAGEFINVLGKQQVLQLLLGKK